MPILGCLERRYEIRVIDVGSGFEYLDNQRDGDLDIVGFYVVVGMIAYFVVICLSFKMLFVFSCWFEIDGGMNDLNGNGMY